MLQLLKVNVLWTLQTFNTYKNGKSQTVLDDCSHSTDSQFSTTNFNLKFENCAGGAKQ